MLSTLCRAYSASSRIPFIGFVTAFPLLPTPDRVAPRLWSWRDIAFAVALAPAVLLAAVAALLLIGAAVRPVIALAVHLALGSVLLALAARRETGFTDLGFTRPASLYPAVTVVAMYACALVAWALALAALRAVTGAAVLDPGDGIDAGDGVLLIALNGAQVIVMGPIVEETLFRGLLFRGLRGYWTFWPAALASGIWFGALHLSASGFPLHVVGGVLYAWAYERSGSLWPPILAHAFINAVVFNAAIS